MNSMKRKIFCRIRDKIFSKSRTIDCGISFRVSFIVRTTGILTPLILYSLMRSRSILYKSLEKQRTIILSLFVNSFVYLIFLYNFLINKIFNMKYSRNLFKKHIYIYT